MATKKFIEQLTKMSPLNILGDRYYIVMHDKRWKEMGTPGTVNFPLGTIYLDTGLSDDRLYGILMHEILEIILDQYTIRLEHPALCALERALTLVLKENPIFMKMTSTAPLETRGNKYEFNDFEETQGATIEKIYVPTEDEKKKEKVKSKNNSRKKKVKGMESRSKKKS